MGSRPWTHLGHEVHVCTKHRLEPLSLFEKLGHGPVVLPHIFLAFLLCVEQFGQVVPESQVHLEAPQPTVKPTARTREAHQFYNVVLGFLNRLTIKSRKHLLSFIYKDTLNKTPT